jgi:hypothetical protein
VVGHGVAASLLSIAVSRMLTPERNSFLVRLIPSRPGTGCCRRPKSPSS